MNKRAILLALLWLPILISCGGNESIRLHRRAATDSAVPVRVITVQYTSAQGSAGFVGTVESTRTAVLRCPAIGTLTSIEVVEGRPVKKGQVLALIESESLQSAHRTAKASLEQAEDAFKRVKLVYGSGAVTEMQYQEVLSKLEQARAAESAARSALEKCTLKAPFDAVVGKIEPSAGMDLAPGEPVIHLTDLNALRVRFALPETEFTAYHEGDKARISVPALGLKTSGTLEAKGISSSPLSRSYECSVSLKSIPQGLMPGMVCKVTLGKDIGKKAIVLPPSAIMTDMNGRYVWTVTEGDTVARKYITVDGYTGGGVCVTGGLSSGERVITEGLSKVSTGMKVKPIE